MQLLISSFLGFISIDFNSLEYFSRINIFYNYTVFHYPYTPSQRGNYHHSMFHNPTAAVNLFHVGKQYLTFCKAEAAVTHNVIGRKIISNVKHSDARNSLPIIDVIRSSHKRHIAPQCVRALQMNATSNDRFLL